MSNFEKNTVLKDFWNKFNSAKHVIHYARLLIRTYANKSVHAFQFNETVEVMILPFPLQ